jgi:hypothetical protein
MVNPIITSLQLNKTNWNNLFLNFNGEATEDKDILDLLFFRENI